MLIVFNNTTDITQYLVRGSVRISEALNNRSNTCSFQSHTFKIAESTKIYVYEVMRATIGANSGQKDIVMDETFEYEELFLSGDEVIVDIGGTPFYATIDNVNHTTGTVTMVDNLPLTIPVGAYIGRLKFAGTVENNPDEEIGTTGSFSWNVTCSDWTPTMNRKNVADTFEDMHIREVIGRALFESCANDVEIVLDTFESAWTEAGVARVMSDELDDKIIGAKAQKTGTTGAGTATRTKTITAQDISTMTDIRLWHKCTDGNGSKITSMKVRIGNDASNYLERDSTMVGNNEDDCWNYENFKIDRGSEVGSCNLLLVDRLQIEVVSNTSMASGELIFDQMLTSLGGFTLKNCTRGFRKFADYRCSYKKMSELINDTSKTLGFVWFLDYERDIHVYTQSAVPARFNITDSSLNYGDLIISSDTSMLRNRVIVKGGEAPGSVLYEQEHVADGSQTSFTLDYKPKTLSVFVDTGSGYVQKTAGVENLVDESTVDFVYNFQEKIIRNGSLATLSAGDKIKVTYYPYQKIVVQVTDNTSIATMKALLGGDGIFEGPPIDDKSIKDFSDARKRGRAEIEAYKNPIISASFITDKAGLLAGQVIRITDSSRSLDQDFLIQRVMMQEIAGAKATYKVDCGSTMFGLIEFFQLLLKKSSDLEIDASELVDIVINYDETITITFNAVFTHNDDEFETASVMERVFDFVGDDGTTIDTGLVGAGQWYVSKTAGASGTAGFGASNHNNGKELFIDVDSSGVAEYMQMRLENLVEAKPSTDYSAYAWVENLVSNGLVGGDGLQLILEEMGITSSVDWDNGYYTFNGSNGVVTSNEVANLYFTTSKQRILSFWFRLNADGVDTFSSQPIILTPGFMVHIRRSDNQINAIYDNAGAKIASYVLGNGDRGRHHIAAGLVFDGTNRRNQLRVDGVLRSTSTSTAGPSTPYTTNIVLGLYSGVYFNGDIAQVKLYGLDGNRTTITNDAGRLYAGEEPKEGIVTSYLKRNTDEGSGVVARDRWGTKNGTHTGGVTHASSGSVPFKKVKNIYGVLATHYLLQNRNEKQDFKRTTPVSFTSDGDAEYFRMIARVDESEGKIGITNITIEEQATESVANPAIADFSQVS